MFQNLYFQFSNTSNSKNTTNHRIKKVPFEDFVSKNNVVFLMGISPGNKNYHLFFKEIIKLVLREDCCYFVMASGRFAKLGELCTENNFIESSCLDIFGSKEFLSTNIIPNYNLEIPSKISRENAQKKLLEESRDCKEKLLKFQKKRELNENEVIQMLGYTSTEKKVLKIQKKCVENGISVIPTDVAHVYVDQFENIKDFEKFSDNTNQILKIMLKEIFKEEKCQDMITSNELGTLSRIFNVGNDYKEAIQMESEQRWFYLSNGNPKKHLKKRIERGRKISNEWQYCSGISKRFCKKKSILFAAKKIKPILMKSTFEYLVLELKIILMLLFCLKKKYPEKEVCYVYPTNNPLFSKIFLEFGFLTVGLW